MSRTAKIVVGLIFILVVISLGLNLFLIAQLRQVQSQASTAAKEFGPQIQGALDEIIADLADFENSSIEVAVDVEQEFPIEVEIPFNEEIEVPIQMTVPISQVIETTITLDLLGTGAGIPIDIAVPIDLEIPIENTVVVPINRTIPISTTVPLDLSVPVAINLGETELGPAIVRLREGLISFSDFLDQLLAKVE